MKEFFDFALYVLKGLVASLLGLKLTNDFTLGQAMIALSVLSVLIGALVIRFRSGSLSSEAGKANRHDILVARNQRFKHKK